MNGAQYGVFASWGIYTRFAESMSGVNMLQQHKNTTSVTIDELVPPLWRSTDVQGLGLEGACFERIGVRTERGDQ